MERLIQDVRFGLRVLWRDRGFALTTMLTLAICIGANAAIFAIVNAVLLRPLPVPQPGRFAVIYNSYPRAGVERASNGVPDYYDRLREVDAFEEQALYNTRGVTVGIDGDPQRITGMIARPSLLRMLEVHPLRGRIFKEDEGEIGNNHRVMLTYALWQQLYAGRDDAVGKELRINGVPYTIVGVLPAGFFFLDPSVKLWMPLGFTPEQKSDDARHSNNWSMVGRLKAGASFALAQQQIDALNARNMERFPAFKEILTNAGFHTAVRPLQDDLVKDIRGTLYLLWGGVLFVLLIGAVNIANLVLVRSTARMKELATRHALGAALSRLTRQLLTETVMLTAAGGAAGLVIGFWILRVLSGMGLSDLPRGAEVHMDGVVVAFASSLALAVGVLVGLVPMVNLRQVNLSQAFREESRSGTSGRAARAVRRTLVTSQVAFAFMLLIGAGLLFASFERILAIKPGFNPLHLLTARVAPPASRYKDDPELRTFSSRLIDRVRAIPGVRQAALTSSIPFGDDYSDSVILAEGYQMAPGESLISPYQISVTPTYFDTMGIAIKQGRVFADSDTESAAKVIIVDEKLARRFWGTSSPIGRRMFKPDNPNDLTTPGPTAHWFTVVGVVSEIRIAGFVATDDRVGAYYFPMAQDPARSMALAVSASGDALALAPAIRRELAAIDPELPLYSVMSMESRMSQTLVDRRAPMILAMAFAAIALFLAAIGIYGVLAYQVSQRTREIGIRMALGSDARAIFSLVVSEGLALLAAGLAIGFIGAFAIRRAMQSQLYGVGAMDPVVLGAVATILALVAVTACLIPARRAAHVDPVRALMQ
ncbi:MAG TPA: ABC transporter permease [Vicinamibacterales bacterium]|nr:ABC transporter permease [Vicinamibacterales bacterium]